MGTKDDSHLVQRIEQAVLAAAQHLSTAIAERRDLGARYKSDASVVTVLDLEAQEIILSHLTGLLPVVSEEDSTTHDFAAHKDFILIDPLDGTTACRRFSQLPPGQVGFGPLVGICRDARLWAAAYVNLPTRMLYVAMTGKGTYEVPADRWRQYPDFQSRKRLLVEETPALPFSALLFYPGDNGELLAAHRLKSKRVVETVYRFGGFANDCTRVARGHEQALLQCSLKAWDFPAALLASEAGLDVIIDPLGSPREFHDYTVQPRCAVLIAAPSQRKELLAALRE